MSETPPNQDNPRPRRVRATPQELADIAAQTARCAGVDVTITPCPEVRIHVGDPPVLRRCSGARFDDRYLLVRTPSGGWRALKIDPESGSVVLRLGWAGGYRAHVVRILTALIYDRLKAGRDQFEPRIAVLAPPEEPVEVRSDPDPPVFPSSEPKRKRPPVATPGPAAEAVAAVPVAEAAPSSAVGPEAAAPAAPSPEPTAPAAPAPAQRPAKPAGPPTAPGGKARPLGGRVRH
jgi:hypothetical protein